MSGIGYGYLRELFVPSLPYLARPAQIRPVTRVERMGDCIAVPAHVAPRDNNPVTHLLFALKHEGTNLQVLSEVMPKLDPGALLDEARRSPTGSYIRLACYLWEKFAGKELSGIPDIGGPTVNVFDPEKYITMAAPRDPRWRVSFNGLGSIGYCPSVEKTDAICRAIDSDILGRTNKFIAGLDEGMMDRALSWAYLHETESTYAIERELPSEDKSRAFMEILHQAHEGRLLSEDYLVELQNSIISNPYGRDASFRTEQNWLRGGTVRGAAGITYLPPPPAIVGELMDGLMTMSRSGAKAIDPIVMASIVSFGFVFIHPFMDGNGRLSRFLFHCALCNSGRLSKGLLLPVSVAMKNDEPGYLKALQSYSKPIRERWSVRWIDGDRYDFKLNCGDSIYRYWDATDCVEFGFRVSERALDEELLNETKFLERYDRIIKAVNDRFDVQGKDLSTLVICCLDNGGELSKNRRKQYALQVQPQVFDFIETLAKDSHSADKDGGGAAGNPRPKG